jgi:hypothetical protein
VGWLIRRLRLVLGTENKEVVNADIFLDEKILIADLYPPFSRYAQAIREFQILVSGTVIDSVPWMGGREKRKVAMMCKWLKTRWYEKITNWIEPKRAQTIYMGHSFCNLI